MANQIVPGAVWEAVEDEPNHFYLIKSYEGLYVYLERLSDGKSVAREKEYVRTYGITRSLRKNELRNFRK